VRGLRIIGVAAILPAAAALASMGALGACGSFSAADAEPQSGDAAALPDGAFADDGASGTEAGGPDGSDRYREAVLADSPIAYFRLEETSGTSAKNEMAGSKVTAILPSTGVVLGVEGISPSRRAVQITNPTVQVNIFGAMTFKDDQPFAVEAWVELAGSQPTSSAVIFSNEDQSASRTGQLLFVNPDNILRAETWSANSLIFYALAPTALPATPTWVHIVFMHSAKDLKDVLYVNGASGDARRTATGGRIAPSAPFSWTGFKGRLDEIAIYDKELPPMRIAAHYVAR
jgi:hypothetical protein